MRRIVRGGLIQAVLNEPATSPVEQIKKSMVDKHVDLIARAAGEGKRSPDSLREPFQAAVLADVVHSGAAIVHAAFVHRHSLGKRC